MVNGPRVSSVCGRMMVLRCTSVTDSVVLGAAMRAFSGGVASTQLFQCRQVSFTTVSSMRGSPYFPNFIPLTTWKGSFLHNANLHPVPTAQAWDPHIPLSPNHRQCGYPEADIAGSVEDVPVSRACRIAAVRFNATAANIMCIRTHLRCRWQRQCREAHVRSWKSTWYPTGVSGRVVEEKDK